jgi:hypothetical protein
MDMKWVWISLGLGAGYVLGTRAGREQFDRLTSWGKGAADDLGLSTASEHVADSARSVTKDLRDATVAKSQAVVGDAANAISGHLESVSDSVTPHGN